MQIIITTDNKRVKMDFIIESWVFIQIELKRLSGWIITNILFSMVIPMGVILMISLMTVDMTKETAIIYISGNWITSISNLCISALAQSLISKRMQNGFEHLATLPIYRISPLIGTFISSAISTIPSLIIMPIIGMVFFRITFFISGWLVFIIIISIITMTGIGAIIGTCIDDYNKSYTISMIIMFVVMFGTPVYYSLDALPLVARIFHRLLPFCYSLEAIRSLMINPVLNSTVIKDIVVLFVFMIVSICFTAKFFTWKQRR
jgi:ABC-type polysaccharide/polyol phosphate export permease